MRYLILALFLGLAACNPSSSDESPTASAVDSPTDGGNNSPAPAPAPENLRIDLPEVTGACLNLEKYFGRLRSMPQTVPARKITTDMSFRATGNNIPRNFLLRLAAGNFQVKDATLADMPEFVEIKQEDCNKVTMKNEGGDSVFKILRAKPDSLTLENEWSGQTTVTWKAVDKMQFEMISNVGDFLCDPNSRGKLQTISEITWGKPEIFTETLAEDAIDLGYLKQVIEATGYPASIYSETNQLSVNRLKELHAWPVRTDLLQCY
ncbi:MAG: hypothetical protein ACXWC9_04210 [Pseudobdellovibrionaceae bacterium]